MKSSERILNNALLLEGYSGMRPKLSSKEQIWFDKAMKLVEELGESDPQSSDKLMALDCMLVTGLAAAGLSHGELHFLIHETATTTCKIAMVQTLKGGPRG